MMIMDYNSLKKEDLSFLKRNNISVGKNHIYYEKIIKGNEKNVRWALSNLFIKSDNKKTMPEDEVCFLKNDSNAIVLRSIGYIKLNKFAVKLSFLNSFYKNFLSEEKSVYYFNYYHKKILNISFLALYEILEYYNLKKITGSNWVTFWKKEKNSIKKKNSYNKNSPFYALKKLQ